MLTRRSVRLTCMCSYIRLRTSHCGTVVDDLSCSKYSGNQKLVAAGRYYVRRHLGDCAVLAVEQLSSLNSDSRFSEEVTAN